MSEHTVNMEEKRVVEALNNVNMLFQASIANSPVGLVPEAAEAQRAGLNKAGQQIVDTLQSFLPQKEDSAVQLELPLDDKKG